MCIPQKCLVWDNSCGGINDEENSARRLEYCVTPRISETVGCNEYGEFEVTIYNQRISARKIMGSNFSGLYEFEKEAGLPMLSEKEYVRRGLTCRVPWTADTLLSPCPFHEGLRICQTHFLGLVEVRKWEGILHSSESPYELQWILQLIRTPLTEEEVLSLVLPVEYKPQRMLDEEQNKVVFLIKRKPDREEY